MLGSLKGKSILLIEDEEMIRNLFLDELEEYGATVYPCAYAKEGIELIGKTTFDAVITDIRMPGISGLEFLEVLKENERNAGIPVIVMTGSINLTAKELYEIGATKVFFKPIQLPEFMEYLIDVVAE